MSCFLSWAESSRSSYAIALRHLWQSFTNCWQHFTAGVSATTTTTTPATAATATNNNKSCLNALCFWDTNCRVLPANCTAGWVCSVAGRGKTAKLTSVSFSFSFLVYNKEALSVPLCFSLNINEIFCVGRIHKLHFNLQRGVAAAALIECVCAILWLHSHNCEMVKEDHRAHKRLKLSKFVASLASGSQTATLPSQSFFSFLFFSCAEVENFLRSRQDLCVLKRLWILCRILWCSLKVALSGF